MKLINGERWYDTQGNLIQAHGGGILQYGGYFYWYGEDKRLVKGKSAGDLYGVSCYRSRDLTEWDYLGNALPVNHEEPDHPLYYKKILERPKVLWNEETGKFVMLMHLDIPDYTYASVGIAVSDHPEGPFCLLDTKHPNGYESRDMGVYQEQDGTAYLLMASHWNSCMRAVKLTGDYLDFTDSYTYLYPLVGKCESREAPAAFQKDGRYYCITSACTGYEPNEADLASADSMLGIWRSLGNPCRGTDAAVTFHAQSTFVLELPDGRKLLMLDIWKIGDISDSRYVWLPIQWDESGIPFVAWTDDWRAALDAAEQQN